MRVWPIVLLVLSISSPLYAQTDPPIQVGVGVGYARALHGDLDFGAPAYSVTIRFPVLRALAFEPEVAYWRHEGLASHGTVTGVPFETRTTFSFWTAAGNVILRGVDDPVVPYGGGGLGIYAGRRQTQVTQSGSVVSETSRTMTPHLGAQVVAGADVRLSSRTRAFGEFRFEVRSFQDPGGGAQYRVMGGARVALR